METLLSRLHRDFEGFIPIKACEAGLPLYFIKMSVEVLEKQKLSTLASYMLHAISLEMETSGGGSLAKIAALLGVQERDLSGTGAQLLQLNLIEQGLPDSEGQRPITLTDLGRKGLGVHETPPVPQRRSCQLHFNALTWTAMPLEEETWSVGDMCKEGVFVLPVAERGNPTLGDFTEKTVKASLQLAPRFQKSDIVALLKLEKSEPEYLAPVQLFLLQHQRTREQRVALYYQRRQLGEETTILQRMYEEGKLIFPEEAALSTRESLTLPPILPQTLHATTQMFLESKESIQELTQSLDTATYPPQTDQKTPEHGSNQEKIRQLTAALEQQQQELIKLQQQAAKDQFRFLETEQHRAFLEQALREAREEVIIISPWITPRACDKKLCQLLGKAIARGVRIRIAYGFGPAESPGNAERNRNNVRQVKRAFEQAITQAKGQRALLEMHETSGTHQKILICDRAFATIGSLNWLSYKGDRDDQTRKEISVVLQRIEDIQGLAKIALQAFSP
jgi:hypothetical protein